MSRPPVAGASDHPWPAWFADTAAHAGLLTNRTLRNYLLGHPPEQWPQVAKATLLYGVLCLQRDHPGQAMVPLGRVREAAQELHAEAALAAALPRIRSQFEGLEADLGALLADENGGGQADSRASVPPARGKPPLAGARVSGAAPPRPASSAAPSEAGPEAVRSRIKLPAGVYPSWWPGHLSETGGRRGAPRAAGSSRPPPRLAYSRPPSAPASVTRDDLPTATHLLVPPRVSSRGGSTAGGRARPEQREPRGANPGQARVALAHQQRLALQRLEQQEAAADGGPRGWGSGSTLGGGVPDCEVAAGWQQEPASPRYDPQATARWLAHFGAWAS